MSIDSLVRSDSRQQNLSFAVAMMMISVATYALQDVFVKLLPPEISVIQICFFRAVFAFVPIIALTLLENPRTVFKTDQWGLHFWRSLFSCFALFCFIASFRLIPLADAYTLTFSCPLFMTALCIPLLKEKVPFWRWVAVLTGFLGVIVMMRPGSGVLDVGGFFALAGGLFYAVSLIFVRKLSHHHQDSTTLIVSTFTLMSALLTAPFLPFVWVSLDIDSMSRLAIIGILGGTAQYAMTQALRMAPVSQLAPFDYASLLWAIGFGYFIFHDVPDLYMSLGASLIIGSGLVILRSEKGSAAI
jgi:drug/metabolite transporter (DMT)-like permease